MNLIFHIGLHKTGTSWLQNYYFSKHPEIELIVNTRKPWQDELIACLLDRDSCISDFDTERCRDLVLNRCKAVDNDPQRKVALVSAERLSGHPLSGAYDRYDLADRIHNTFPQARIICVLRRQVDVLPSVYRQMVSEGFAGSFDDMFCMESWKGRGFDAGMFCYDRLVEKYQSIFGGDSICFLSYEQMRSSPQIFLSELCEFIGVACIKPEENREINTSMSGLAITGMRLINRFRKTEYNRHPLFSINERLARTIRLRLKSLSGKKDALAGEQSSRIREYYRESNLRLAGLLGERFSDYV